MKDDDLKEFDALGLDELVPAPPHMKQRWHDSIDLAAQREQAAQQKAPRPFSFTSFFWGAAITATLAIGIGIGLMLSDNPTIIPDNDYVVHEAILEDPNRSAVFSRVLQVHLRDTRASIESLPAVSNEDQIALILQIVQQNRLFEQAAERNDAESLARVLRAFEPTLLQLTASDLSPEDAAALRAQLAFQLKIMLTKLERGTSKVTLST